VIWLDFLQAIVSFSSMKPSSRNGSKYGVPTFLVCCAISFLPACGEQFGGHTGTPASSSSAYGAVTFIPVPPEPVDLRISLIPDALGTVKFMALGGCELQTTLGKYHSKLGRGASNSQLLLLNLEYLRLAPACMEYKQNSGEAELASTLERARKLKHDQLPATLYNATLGNTEFQQFWHNTATLKIHTGQRQLTLSALQAVNALARQWLSGEYFASNLEFEILLSEIARGNYLNNGQLDYEVSHNILSLERQLTSTIPPEYRAWQALRKHYFARLEPPTKLD
jgi:hypothetical protein